MQDAEYCSIELDAEQLYQGDDEPTTENLARALSEAIIETVTSYKFDGWKLVNMDFQGGRVTINFTRPLGEKT